jgi:hypothetical protein
MVFPEARGFIIKLTNKSDFATLADVKEAVSCP